MNPDLLNRPACDPALWLLDPQVIFLNHGSFGACPKPVLEFQRKLRDEMERQPLEFLHRKIEEKYDEARQALAAFVGADADDLVFVPNATTGVNAVLRSLEFKPGDELLTTDQEYNACRNALDFAAERAGATIKVVPLSFPLRSADDAVEAVLTGVTSRTRLALLDHVTSQTGMVLPIEKMIRELAARNVETLVDGAHAPGMVPLNLREIGAAYYSGNCHKWLCAPKGAGFLYVRRDLQKAIRPTVISHGANSPRADRSRFQIEFGWMGTHDPTACLSVPEALRFMASRLPGGWPEVMARNHALALAARQLLCRSLEIEPPCPDNCIGSLAAVPVPDPSPGESLSGPLYLDPLQNWLREKYNLELPVIHWPAHPKRLIRVSAQLYNSLPQYQILADSLAKVFR